MTNSELSRQQEILNIKKALSSWEIKGVPLGVWLAEAARISSDEITQLTLEQINQDLQTRSVVIMHPHNLPVDPLWYGLALSGELHFHQAIMPVALRAFNRPEVKKVLKVFESQGRYQFPVVVRDEDKKALGKENLPYDHFNQDYLASLSQLEKPGVLLLTNPAKRVTRLGENRLHEPILSSLMERKANISIYFAASRWDPRLGHSLLSHRISLSDRVMTTEGLKQVTPQEEVYEYMRQVTQESLGQLQEISAWHTWLRMQALLQLDKRLLGG